MKRLAPICVAVAVLASTSAEASREGFVIHSTRSVGMGGAGVALRGPDNAVFLNPALLVAIERDHFRLLEVQAAFNQNTFTHYEFYGEHEDEFANLDSMSDADRNAFYYELLGVARDKTVFGFQGMGPLSIVRPGYSVGVYERAVVDYDVREGASSIPLIHADAIADGAVIVGGGSKLGEFFGHSLCIGANAKFVHRTVATETKTAPAAETIDNIQVYKGWTMAFDLGVLLDTGRWSFGAGFYDFNWPTIEWSTSEDLQEGLRTPDAVIDGSIRLGAAYESAIEVPGLLEDVVFAFDVESPSSEEMGFFKKLSFGAEGRLANLVFVRTGFHQGYPTAGFAFPLKIVKIEYAFSGEALGRHPGQLDSWNHYVSVGLGTGY
jgi:hypothetical protein